MNLRDYTGIAEQSDIRAIEAMAARLKGRTVLHVNSTSAGGGVAELLQRMVPLMNGLGLNTRWEVLKGTKAFFEVTKSLHNALQGKGRPITKRMWDIYESVNRRNMDRMNLEADYVIIHDPQPALLVEKKKSGQWIWRCPIDISAPDRVVWHFLKGHIERYDAAIFSVSSGPEGLKTLVNACHGRGMAVILDVVYNHFGPEGNYIDDFGPYLTDRYKTSWGKAINFDGPHCDEVRSFFIENAVHWAKNYHIDALRLDAVHNIFDFSARPF